MPPHLTGVLVSNIAPLTDTAAVLRKGDVIVSFDGTPIANDGSVPFRHRERISFDFLVTMKNPGDTAEVEVREGSGLPVATCMHVPQYGN